MSKAEDVARDLARIDEGFRCPGIKELHESVQPGTRVVSSSSDLGTIREQVSQALGELHTLRDRLESLLDSLKE